MTNGNIMVTANRVEIELSRKNRVMITSCR